MKINRNLFNNFLKAINVGDDIKINEVILNFTEGGLQVIADIPYNIGQVRGIILKDLFEYYVPYGEIGLDDLSNLINIINIIKSDEINIVIEGSAMMIMSDTKQVLKQLVDPQYIKRTKIIELPEYKSAFELLPQDIKTLKDEARKNKCIQTMIRSVKGKVTITNIGKNIIKNTYKQETVNEEHETTFTKYVIHLLTNKTSDSIVEVLLSSNNPLLINFRTKQIRVQYVVNQIIKEETEDQI